MANLQIAQRLVNIWMKCVNFWMYFGDWSNKYVLYTIDGSQFSARVGTSDKFVVWEVFTKQDYTSNPEFTLSKNDVVLDIGANIGAFTIFAGRQVKKVYAYEALQDNYTVLRKNISLNSLKNVSAFNIAVSSKVGKITFHVADETFGGSSMFVKSYSKRKITVPTTTLGRIFSENKISRVDFFKLDVEGAEYEILLNATSDELSKIKRISMEYHDNLDHGHTYTEIVSKLEENGFVVTVPTSWFVRTFIKVGMLRAIRK